MKTHPKREELIELLWTFSCDGTSNPENVVDDIIIMFEDRWIPITERLPEVDEHVLINTESFVGYGSLASFKEWRYTQCLGSTEDTAYLKETEVTHWMPLPEPYKPKKR